jgi:glucosamine 6-phosphate synthetase-like amidotransferase/phosphosugar isomerase protein
MCGIFGIVVRNEANWERAQIKSVLGSLAKLSQSRGKDSSGLAFRNECDKSISVIKAPMPITSLLKHKSTSKELNTSLSNYHQRKGNACAVIGHSRLATNGSQLLDYNNQPVIKEGIVGVHNGIIVNVNELWRTHVTLSRQYDIDTEVMFSLFKFFERESDSSIVAISKAIKKIEGTVSTGFFIDNKNEMILATNHGSLYLLTNFKDILMFASERHIIDTVIKRHKLNQKYHDLEVLQVVANTGYLINLNDFKITHFKMDSDISVDLCSPFIENYRIHCDSVNGNVNNKSLIVDLDTIIIGPKATAEKKLLEHNIGDISCLRRITRNVSFYYI